MADAPQNPKKNFDGSSQGEALLQPLAVAVLAQSPLMSVPFDKARALAAAERLLGRLASLDARCFEGVPAVVAVPHLCAGPLAELDVALEALLAWCTQVTQAAGATLQADDMPPLMRRSLPQAPLAPGHEGLLASHDEAFTKALDAAQQALLAQQPSSTVALALQRIVVAEVARVRGRLAQQALLGSKWGLIAAIDTSRREARMVVRAFLPLILGSRKAAPMLQAACGPELAEEGVIVRNLLLSFQSEALGLVHAGLQLQGSTLSQHMRELVALCTHLFSETHYGWLRAQDRYAVRQWQLLAEAWLSSEARDAHEGQALQLELAAIADTFGHINQRAILLMHDHAAQTTLLALLQAGKSAPYEVLQALVEPLCWRLPALRTHLQQHAATKAQGAEPYATWLTQLQAHVAQALPQP